MMECKSDCLFNIDSKCTRQSKKDMTVIGKWKNDFKEFINELSMPRDDYKGIMEYINEVPNEVRWISVSERLPEKGEYGKVLVTYIPSGGTLWTTVIIAHYSDLMGIAKPSFHIGEVGKESFQNITKQVIAWMPLPKPYKAESEGTDAHSY